MAGHGMDTGQVMRAGAPIYDGAKFGEMQAYQPPSELGSQESNPPRHELA